VRGCKADALTIGANRQNFGDPDEKAHPVVNALSNACMQADRLTLNLGVRYRRG